MAQPVQNINHSAFRSMFKREKLSEKKMYVIEQPLPAAPTADSNAQVLIEWNTLYDAYNEVACLMLGSMTPELHKQFKNYSPYEMLQELKYMFEKQAGVERFDLIQTFHACKLEEAKGNGKANGKGNDKHVDIPKPKNPKPAAKEHPTKDDTCHHCKEVGRWKMNYPVYLVELLKKKKQVGSASSSVLILSKYSHHIATSVSTQRKRRRHNSQVGSSSCEAGQ
nr:hypothetical protein [Tanacetum cinerariifolium]